MEIRFCCGDRDTPPECPEHIGTCLNDQIWKNNNRLKRDEGIWSEWANADKNKNDGGDFELLSRHRELSPESVCEMPHSVDYRQVEDTLDWEIKNDQKITTDSQMGLLCYDQGTVFALNRSLFGLILWKLYRVLWFFSKFQRWRMRRLRSSLLLFRPIGFELSTTAAAVDWESPWPDVVASWQVLRQEALQFQSKGIKSGIINFKYDVKIYHIA